jgi:hypothetical protein
MEMKRMEQALADIKTIYELICLTGPYQFDMVSIYVAHDADMVSGTLMAPVDNGEPEIIIESDGADIVSVIIDWNQYVARYDWSVTDTLEVYADQISEIVAAGPVKNQRRDCRSRI